MNNKEGQKIGPEKQHLAFLKSQINLMNNEESFHDTTLVCRNGVLCLNSLLTFLLFQENLTNIDHGLEDLVVLLPDVDVEVVHINLETLLGDTRVVKGVANFSLVHPFQSQSVQSAQGEERGRRNVTRSGFVCDVCGKYFKRTKWEAGAHDLLHKTVPGCLSCLVPSGSLGKCLRRFASKEKLLEHMQLIHKIQHFSCSLCNMEFRNEKEKGKHNSSVHQHY